MADFTLYYWPVPFRGQFIRAILAYAGKAWDEPDDVADIMSAAPDKQPVPFMGPPMLIDHANDFKLAEMPAIALYLGDTLGLLPDSPQGRAMAVKIVNDANDIIDEITLQGGMKMWTPETWKAFLTRLRRWMDIFEVTGRRNGLTRASGFMVGDRAGVADIVTATLWWTMTDRFAPIGEIFREQAPLVAALTERLMAEAPMQGLIDYTNKRFGPSAYCGGQIEASIRKVVSAQ